MPLNINFVLVIYGTKKFVLEDFNRIHEIGLYFILRSCLTLERKRSAFKQEKSLSWESTGRHLSLGMCLKSGHKLNIADPIKVRFLNSTVKVLTSNAFTLAKSSILCSKDRINISDSRENFRTLTCYFPSSLQECWGYPSFLGTSNFTFWKYFGIFSLLGDPHSTNTR